EIEEAAQEAMQRLQGAYAVIIATENKLLAFRDPYGVRPLCLGRMGSNYALASESCGLNIMGAYFIRELEPGEMVIMDEEGLRSIQVVTPAKPSLCIFEFIYFARPDSYLYGRNLYDARKSMGMSLAKECPVDADLVIPVPDTGTPAAIGYA
ncbi:amidophosphoribosyltransferase, partial [Candidatus Saccharibacteria bacterium]|nr:amidophosphoribosyltransferase [Candidatus Saccharibacteria bacterium]